jgi:hypothetical protein
MATSKAFLAFDISVDDISETKLGGGVLPAADGSRSAVASVTREGEFSPFGHLAIVFFGSFSKIT